MDRFEKRTASRWPLPGAMLAGLLNPVPALCHQAGELPVHRIPNLGQGAEFYFAPDSSRDSAAGTRQMTQYLMDINSLNLAPAAPPAN